MKVCPDCKSRSTKKTPARYFSPEKLMEIDDTIWQELGITSGTQLSQDAQLQRMYLERVHKTLGKPEHQYGSDTYDALEDANYHTMNQALIIFGYARKSAKPIYMHMKAHPEWTNFNLIKWPENTYV
jgi:hypothetical protein